LSLDTLPMLTSLDHNARHQNIALTCARSVGMASTFYSGQDAGQLPDSSLQLREACALVAGLLVMCL
jgi:hypothetical protein